MTFKKEFWALLSIFLLPIGSGNFVLLFKPVLFQPKYG